jgi:CRISPR-associated protein Cmr6
MEYRAQFVGRSQRQYIKKPKDAPAGWRSDIQTWIDEWVERVDSASPFTTEGLRIVEVQIDWRLISNSGVDEGVIRPVIGAGGWPMIPGSGIKGLFRRACAPERLLRWCGSPCASGDLSPGILRFHGAWPAQPSSQAESDWTHGLLDVAHPQQNWQVGFTNGNESHSAFGVASLYRPKLRIGLSSTDPTITEAEWDQVVDTLKQALRAGIGGRTCVGYGTTGRLSGDVLFQCGLEGQGPAAKLLDGTPEFRPTMFRAAIRGMALRLFGGLTDAQTAMRVVGRLFGSLSRDEGQNVGLLATAYTEPEVNLGSYGQGSWEQPIYATSGLLQWRLMRAASRGEDPALLNELLAALHGLTMAMAGYGRGWRRPDHRIFLSDYGRTPIGCHWQWSDPAQLPPWIHVQSPSELTQLLQRSQKLASRWLQATAASPGQPASWREVIHPQRMRIWTREASDPLDARAIEWFHWEPRSGSSDQPPDAREIKRTDLAGRVNQVGRIWNRMLPLINTSEGSGGPSTPMGSSSTARPGAAMARPGGAMARPANPMARPGSATARPSAVAGGRSAQNRRPQAPRGEVSITLRSERFLEILVLFPEKRLSPSFISMMDRGANEDFSRLEW